LKIRKRAKMRKDRKQIENLKKKNMKKRKKSMIRELLETVISAGIIAFIIITFIGQVTVVRGASMEPTLHDNERLIANKISYRFETPERGEIIIFRPPLEIKRNYIKRIIGVPGDEIEIANGEVYVNGEKLEEFYIENRSHGNMPPTIVPDDSFFVLGDNRPNSSDSRYWGFVPRKNVVGKAWVVFWPLNRIRLP
jgi:signal peptidase I